MPLLLIDNYDSFVYNLARYFERLGQRTVVVRNDAIDAAGIRRMGPQAVVLSPGPCTPDEAGNSIEIVRELHTQLPMLGVCLGHQTIAAALGGKVVRASEPMHGRTSSIRHSGSRLFSGLPSPMTVCRYHSLVVESRSLPSALEPTAWTDDPSTPPTVMAVEHKELPVFGVQFHPEAILTEHGYRLLANFLTISGCTVAEDIDRLTVSENRHPNASEFVKPNAPVTF